MLKKLNIGKSKELSPNSSSPTSTNTSPNTNTNTNVNATIFGIQLYVAVSQSRLSPSSLVPSVVEQSIAFLDKKWLQEEGLYRISGSSSQIANLKALYNSGQKIDLEEQIKDPHTVSGLLKLYFRELPEPLLTRDLSHDFHVASMNSNEEERKNSIINLLNRLPKENRAVLEMMLGHLIRVSKYCDVNKMSVTNLEVVFSPCLEIPPSLFQAFMYNYDVLFKGATISAPESPRGEKSESKNVSSFDDWDDLEQSLDKTKAPIIETKQLSTSLSSSSLKSSGATPTTPKSTTTATATTTPSTSASVTSPKTNPQDEILSNEALEKQLKELDMALDFSVE